MNEPNGSAPVTKADLASLEERLLARLEQSETSLLKAFRSWAVRFETRFKASEILVGGFNERLSSLEERVGDLEDHPSA
jgi:hypothetical protein